MSNQTAGAGTSDAGPATRLALAGDIPALVEVVNAAFAIETFIEGERTDAAEVADRMRRGEFVVAEDGTGRIVASVYVECQGDRGYFGMLAVEPTRQGTGLGRAMVEVAETRCRARGATHVDIMVLSLRLELLPFYRRLGYAVVGTEEFRPERALTAGATCHGIILSKPL